VRLWGIRNWDGNDYKDSTFIEETTTDFNSVDDCKQIIGNIQGDGSTDLTIQVRTIWKQPQNSSRTCQRTLRSHSSITNTKLFLGRCQCKI
jgi:hypothetical protein